MEKFLVKQNIAFKQFSKSMLKRLNQSGKERYIFYKIQYKKYTFETDVNIQKWIVKLK